MPANAREHNIWLSLLGISGPFLSNRVLEEEFHEGLDAADPELNKLLRAVYDVWLTSQERRPPDSAEHSRWILYVLAYILGMPLLRVDDHDPQAVGLKRGPALLHYRTHLPEHGAELSPAYALFVRSTTPSLLVQEYNRDQKLDESIEHQSWPASPATRMETLLQATKVPLGLVTNGEQWMLVHTLPNITTSFVTWHAHLWLEEPLTLRAFRSLLHLHRFAGLAADESLLALLEKSADDQQEVTIELGKQVRQAVEVWLQALNRINPATLERTFLSSLNEASIYEAALTVMMRLVFLLYAEERRLLPLGTSQLYDQNYAASTLLQQLRERASKQADTYMEKRFDAWSRLLTLFRIVYNGVDHQDLSLRAYGGDLFDPDRFPFLEGRAPYTSWQTSENDPLPIDNRTVMHLLEALQLLRSGGSREARRLSFRALDVEQIGHVYEGLLDHTAKRATEPLLSLKGKQQSSAEVALATLETMREQKGESGLLDLLEKETERQRSTLKKELAYTPDPFERGKLLAACGNDDDLLLRVLPYAGLLRYDSFGFPLVILPGAIYMTAGSDRRSTGTHYTPRTLTVPMVKYTLEPLVYTGPAEGWEQNKWQLRPAGEILSLKICDMAVGSGAFLVQSCRYLAEHLMEAWEDAAELYPGMPQIAPEGLPSEGADGETLLPIDAEERRALAQRIIAERCLYGVDKNHLAIEMAKLSLWLITLSKDLPFTFLNHALREGDSLLGVSDINQLKRWSVKTQTDPDKPAEQRFVEMGIENALTMAQKLRSEIRRLPDKTAQDLKEKKQKLRQVEEATELVALGADLFTLLNQLEYTQEKYPTLPNEIEYLLLVNTYQEAQQAQQGYNDIARHKSMMVFEEMRERVNKLLSERDPFHWPLEFPETFVQTLEEPGFDALLSNPPFQGGQRITGALSTDYREYLVKHLAYGKRGSADLCAYFFLRAGNLIRLGGQSSMLATKTIAQGVTRGVGLDQIITSGWTIPRATSSREWPGDATVSVSQIWLRHGEWHGSYILDDKLVEAITPSLTAEAIGQGSAYVLVANAGKSFQGSTVLGKGFILEPEIAQSFIEKDSRNREVLFPYLNADDINSRADQSPSRWIINFHNWPLEIAKTYSDCIKIVQEQVKTEREGKTFSKSAREKWWIYERRRPELYNTIAEMERVLVIPLHSKYMICIWQHTNMVLSHALCVLAFQLDAYYSMIQCSFHDAWARVHSSSLGETLRYTPSTCFEKFPFPQNLQDLGTIGTHYDKYRKSITLSRQEGLTDIYNRFHDPYETASDIAHLRELHREMDETVARAYGWEDLDLGHGFHETRQGVRYTISEEARNEVLGRLLTLNHERYEEEVRAGLHDKGAKKSKGAAKGMARGKKPKGGSVVREETVYGLVEQGKLLLE